MTAYTQRAVRVVAAMPEARQRAEAATKQPDEV